MPDYQFECLSLSLTLYLSLAYSNTTNTDDYRNRLALKGHSELVNLFKMIASINCFTLLSVYTLHASESRLESVAKYSEQVSN